MNTAVPVNSDISCYYIAIDHTLKYGGL